MQLEPFSNHNSMYVIHDNWDYVGSKRFLDTAFTRTDTFAIDRERLFSVDESLDFPSDASESSLHSTFDFHRG